MELVLPTPTGPRAAYVYTAGQRLDRAKASIVFVHGALNDHSVWTLLARWFAHHGHNVLAVDLPGHGRSPGRPLASIEACADWLVALVEAVDAREVAWVGHSMGSLIAMEAAVRAADRTRRLVMAATAYPMRVSAELLETARLDPLLAIDRVNAFSHAGIAPKPSAPGPGAWLRGSSRALMRRLLDGQPEVNLFQHDFELCDRYAAGLETASRVACPVAVIVGDKDQMTQPRHAASLVRAMRATSHSVPAGHSLMAEAPDRVLAALRTALA